MPAFNIAPDRGILAPYIQEAQLLSQQVFSTIKEHPLKNKVVEASQQKLGKLKIYPFKQKSLDVSKEFIAVSKEVMDVSQQTVNTLKEHSMNKKAIEFIFEDNHRNPVLKHLKPMCLNHEDVLLFYHCLFWLVFPVLLFLALILDRYTTFVLLLFIALV